MKFTKIGVFIICVFFGVSVLTAYGADVAKIGIIDFQRILATSDAGKAAQEKITKKGKALENDLKAKGMAIEESKQRYEQGAQVMSQEARGEKERELKIKILDFKDLEKKHKSEFNEFNMKLVGAFRDDVVKVVDIIGKKQGFLLILEKRESGIVYAPSQIDITDEVIEKYNAEFTKKSN
jgi:outer membrane protein